MKRKIILGISGIVIILFTACIKRNDVNIISDKEKDNDLVEQKIEFDPQTIATWNNEADFTVTLTVNGKGVIIVKYIGHATFVNIPGIIQDMPVREIGHRAFADSLYVTSVVIPEGITTLGDSAFNGCRSLTSITLPNSLNSIGSFAFGGCTSLTSIILPEGITVIQRSTFGGCTSLTSIILPESLIRIGERAFHGCSAMTFIEIPNSVIEIGNAAFQRSGIKSFNWPAKVTIIRGSVPANGLVETYGMFNYCRNLESIIIPEGVIEIGPHAFDGTALTNITLPSTIRRIGSAAFNTSSLTTVNIPESVQRIEFTTGYYGYAFSRCDNLTLTSQAALRRVGYPR